MVRPQNWNAPPWTPQVPGLVGVAVQCDDRIAHGPKPSHRSYRHPCSSVINIENPMRPEFLGTANANQLYWQKPCPREHDGAEFTVCRYCRDHAKQQNWFKIANTMITRLPRALDSIRSNVFLAPMCRQCEQREQLFSQQFLPDASLPAGHPHIGNAATVLPANVVDMADFPRNTCICLSDLERHEHPPGPTRLCRDHLVQRWNGNRDLLVDNVRFAKTFLEDITLHLGNTRRASRATKNARGWDMTRNPPRLVGPRFACRCGQDPVPHGTSEAYLCLACEGIVHVVDLATLPLPPTPVPDWTNQNYHTNPGMFILYRTPTGGPRV